jgi:hypothetical protein
MVVTSTYSGTGCFELSAHQVFCHAQSVLGIPDSEKGDFVSWASWDKCPVARRVLLAGLPHCRSEHVFGDISERCFPTDLAKLRMMEGEFMQLWKDSTMEYENGGLSKVEYVAIRDDLGSEMFGKLSTELQGMEFQEECHCYCHDRKCPWCPRSDPRFVDSYWVEGAGSTCCPFSGMGKQGRWLDQATLPFLIWAYSTRYTEPDSGIHECVPGFTERVLEEIFDPVEVPLKSVLARPSVVDQDVTGYEVRSCVYSPTDIGIPAARPRRYSAFHLRGIIQPFPLSFEDCFFRKVILDGTVFMVAREGFADLEILELWQAMKTRKSLGLAPLAEGTTLERLLPAGDYERLEGFQLLAERKGFQDPESQEWNVPMAVVNVTQTETHSKTVSTKVMPTLLRRSRLVDIVKGRVIPAAEHWLIMGFPHPQLDGSTDHMAHFFPCPELVGDEHDQSHLSGSDQRALCGNAMHWSQVGVWFLFNLACTSKLILPSQSCAEGSPSRVKSPGA